jgi:hypothetical protein
MEKYPLSTKAAKYWYLKLIIENLKNQSITDDEIQQVQAMGLVNDDISGILQANPIALCPFFDENDIYIEISVNMNKTFSVKILTGGGMIVDSKEYNRKEAEIEAVTMAIKLLETILKNQEEDGQDSTTSGTEIPE